MKTKLLTVLLSVFLLTAGAAFAQTPSISLESVDGLFGSSTDTLIADGNTTITFNLRLTSNSATNYGGLSNGFRVYSPDGANWGSTSGDTLFSGWATWFSLNQAINVFSGDGVASDTVGFIFARLTSTGLPSNFDSVGWSISIGPIATDQHAKTVCLDSSFFIPNAWKWAAPDAYPDWDGPHCYTVVDPVLEVNTVDGAGLPISFALKQNYPNPFNPTTTIKFDVPRKTHVNLAVYNVLGQKVRTLVDEAVDAGVKLVEWDGTNDGGVSVASGIYFYRIEAADFTATKKMMMLK